MTHLQDARRTDDTVAPAARGSARGFSLIEVLIVLACLAVVSGMAVPMMGSTLGSYRLSGDARSLTSTLGLAKLRAASGFTRTRLFVDLAANSFHVELWQKTGPGWVVDGGTVPLSPTVTFGIGVVAAAPPNTQAAIAQAPACLGNDGAAIANTACVIFNSRGIPVDAAGAPFGADAIYLTDNTAVMGITLSATGLTRLWRTNPTAVPSWALL